MAELTLMEASRALAEWFWPNRSKLPADVLALLDPHMAPNQSSVVAIARAAEIIYGARDRLPQPALELGAKLAAYCGDRGFFEMGAGRGEKISLIMRRESGERAKAGKPWPKKTADPEPAVWAVPKERGDAS